jgi:GDP-mannose 6-dehydrogenase
MRFPFTTRKCDSPDYFGADRRYIEAQLPHIGDLLRPTLAEVKLAARGHRRSRAVPTPALSKELAGLVAPEQRLIDLVGLPETHGLPCVVDGLCW